MFGRSFKLFEAFGVAIRIDASWFIIVLLVSWSLATSLFPVWLEGHSRITYWAMGVAGAVGLFISLIAHELAHAVTAQQFNVHVRGITLFLFGGVAELDREPPSPGDEFWVAVAGPVASIVIAFLTGAAAAFGAHYGFSPVFVGVLRYLALINTALVAFNMVPAFPLDGGRILRSALWKWKNSLRWATRVTSTIGSAFGLLLIVLGVFAFISGDFIGGMWWFLIGMFLRQAAQMSYQQLLVRRALEGEPVSHLMQPDPKAVPVDASVQDLVDDYVYRYHHKMFPVVDDGKLMGCVTVQQVKQVPREQWASRPVSEVMEPCSPENTVPPNADAMETLAKMNRTDRSRLLVVDHNHLEGVISLKDLMKFISLKVELE